MRKSLANLNVGGKWGGMVGSQKQSISKDAKTSTHPVNSREASKTDEQWVIGEGMRLQGMRLQGTRELGTRRYLRDKIKDERWKKGREIRIIS